MKQILLGTNFYIRNRQVFGFLHLALYLMFVLRYWCLFAHSGVQHILCWFFIWVFFCCFRLVSCVWWCPTHIVLCFFFGLSSSCVLCMMLSNRYCVVFIVLFVFVLCLVYSGVQRLLWCVLCFDCVRLVSCA